MKHLLFIFSLLLSFSSCMSPIQHTQAQFNRPAEEVIQELQKLYKFDEVRIIWSEDQSEGLSSKGSKENIKWEAHQLDLGRQQSLKLYLTNGSGFPEEITARGGIAKEVMQVLIGAIDNAADYENFSVIFVHEAVYDGMAMRSENPFVFSLADLK